MHVEKGVPRGGGTKGPVLVALEKELARTMAGYRSERDPPYYVGYEVSDRRDIHVSAERGALVRSNDTRRRTLDVDVRVGTPQLDNTHALRDQSRMDYFESWPEPVALTQEDDERALRTRIWSRTEERYRSAVERLTKVRAQQKLKVEEEDRSHDFSSEKAATYIDPPARIEIDRPGWEEKLRGWSALFRAHPDILDSAVALDVSAATRSLATSEGAAIQMPWTHARLSIAASAKAEDGMDLSRYESFDVPLVQGLPDDAHVRAAIQGVIDDVLALRRAPIAEPWAGPAILDGRAAGVFFHEVFGHRVEGHRQKSEEEGQTFAKKIGQRVMPEFMRVYDDPTIRSIGGIDLNGHYFFDDEGVAAQRASLVEDGVLKTFLLSRSPAAGFTKSNGHGRRQEGASVVARQANLMVEAANAVPVAVLKKQLIAEIVRQKKPYGLRFHDIQGGYTMTSRDGPQAFKVLPVVVYRVYPDGREELVRGVDLEGTPLVALTKILAAGDDVQVFNGHCGAESGWVGVAAASPSLLVEQIEIARKEKSQDRPPVLPAPALKEPR